jgi:hypothetical protein
MSTTSANDYTGAALRFVTALTKRDFAAAYELTSTDYRSRVSLASMQAAFDAIVPEDFGPIASVEVGHTMEDWPDRRPSDAGWVYVSIAGAMYSEAVTVVVTSEQGSLKIREAEFGRP